MALPLGIWSALVWHAPPTDDVVTVVEGTTGVAVFRRDQAAEHAAFRARINQPQSPSCEEHQLYVDVQTYLLEHATCVQGSQGGKGVVTRMKSWNTMYPKTRSGGRDAKWENTIQCFVVNGEEAIDPESQFLFPSRVLEGGTHGESHVLGKALAECIASGDVMKTKLRVSIDVDDEMAAPWTPLRDPGTPDYEKVDIELKGIYSALRTREALLCSYLLL